MQDSNEDISNFIDFDDSQDVIEELGMTTDAIEELNIAISLPSTRSIQISKLYLGKKAYVDYAGVINAGAMKIQDVADPTLDQDVATKKYIDSKLATMRTELLASIARTVELEQQLEQLYQTIYRLPRTSTIQS